jgi:hypothetical protein
MEYGEGRNFLSFTGTIQKTAESAEARREKQHTSALLCVLCDIFLKIILLSIRSFSKYKWGQMI